MMKKMDFVAKSYLATANAALPKGWEFREGQRMAATSGAPTFTLILVWESPFVGTTHTWLVYVDMPRRTLKGCAEDVAREGLLAITKHGYTSRVRWKGYKDETVGLREALAFIDSNLANVFDSQEFGTEAPQ